MARWAFIKLGSSNVKTIFGFGTTWLNKIEKNYFGVSFCQKKGNTCNAYWIFAPPALWLVIQKCRSLICNFNKSAGTVKSPSYDDKWHLLHHIVDFCWQKQGYLVWVTCKIEKKYTLLNTNLVEIWWPNYLRTNGVTKLGTQLYNLTLESSADRLTVPLATLKLEFICPSIEAEGCALCAGSCVWEQVPNEPPLATYHQGNNLKGIRGAQSVLMFLDSPISLSLSLMRLPPHTSLHQYRCGSQPTQHSTKGILTPPSCSKRHLKRSPHKAREGANSNVNTYKEHLLLVYLRWSGDNLRERNSCYGLGYILPAWNM